MSCTRAKTVVQNDGMKVSQVQNLTGNLKQMSPFGNHQISSSPSVFVTIFYITSKFLIRFKISGERREGKHVCEM